MNFGKNLQRHFCWNHWTKKHVKVPEGISQESCENIIRRFYEGNPEVFSEGTR